MLIKRFTFRKLSTLIFQCCKCSTNQYTNHSQLMNNEFGLTEEQTDAYVYFHKLSNFEPKAIKKTIDFCRNIGFDNETIISNPLLLRTNAQLMENRYHLMQEGKLKITPYTLSKFRTIYYYKLSRLKAMEILNKNDDLIQNFITHLDTVPPSLKDAVTTDDLTFNKAHFKTLTEYLKHRLQFTEDDVNELRRVHVGIHRRSFRFLVENIAFAEQLGFTPIKMLKYGYILHNYPQKPKEVLEKFPTLAGYDTKLAFRMYPKLITISAANYEKIFKILQEYDISDEAIVRRLNIFQLSPETVKFRLEELSKDKDLKLLLHNPNILKLVVHHNRAKMRLNFLKKLQLKCTSVTVLGNDSVKFDVHIKGGQDVHSVIDVNSFLSNLLGLPVKQFEPNLKKHKNYLNVPLTSIEASYRYLIAEQFKPKEIAQVASLLLYPPAKIKHAKSKVTKFKRMRQKQLNAEQNLNLLLYFIEREYHFTGNGIWTHADNEIITTPTADHKLDSVQV